MSTNYFFAPFNTKYITISEKLWKLWKLRLQGSAEISIK